MGKRARARNAALLALGMLGGVAAVVLVAWLFVRTGEIAPLRVLVAERLGLPADVWTLESVSRDGVLKIALRDVAILDERGDTIASAPRARMSLDARSLSGTAPITLNDVELERPYVRLVEEPDGEWNIFRAFTVTAAGQEVGTAAKGRPIVLRGVRIRNGRMLLATPWTEADHIPGDTLGGALELARVGGRTMRVRTARDIDARLSMVRFAGDKPWRVEIASLSAQLGSPELHLTQLAGSIEEHSADGIRFTLETLRTDHSVLSGAGTVRFTAPMARYDLALRAEPVDFRDLRWLVPALPDSGVARLALRMESPSADRTIVRVSDADVTSLGSHVSGHLALELGPTGILAFEDTRLTVDPLRLSTIEALAVGRGMPQLEDLPYTGEIRGTVETAEPTEGVRAGTLDVDLLARLVPKGEPGAVPSVVSARGGVAFAAGKELRLEHLRVEAQPFYLAGLTRLFPEQREYLRGTLRGGVSLSGTLSELELAAGDLSYTVGEATTRLAGLAGTVTLKPELHYDLRAEANDLALATLTEFFPALPFRRATLSGPIAVTGDLKGVRFRTDLVGSAGEIAMSGTASFGPPLSFDVSGRLSALVPGSLITREIPLQGPLSGTFSVQGTTAEFGFAVDLTQGAESRFALHGRIFNPGGPPRFEVAGQVENFRIGALIGQPMLFPSPMTGSLSVAGGGGRRYDFDVDLRGAVGLLVLGGWYLPGEVPSYAVRGRVAELDLRRLPTMASLPQTQITAAIDIEGRGLTPETLQGRYTIDATSSVVGGRPVDTALARLRAENGVLLVDTLALALGDARLSASGTWGLTHPVAEPLRFSLNAPHLDRLAPLLTPRGQVPPQVTGNLRAEGWVSGSFREPTLRVALTGTGLRYDQWQAATLMADAELSKDAAGWRGSGSVNATDALLAQLGRLRTLHLTAQGGPTTVAVDLTAQRDNGADLAVRGTVDFVGQTPHALDLETLTMRSDGTVWQLEAPARVLWSGSEGIEVHNLVLRRQGVEPGWVEIDGRLPTAGSADLQVRAGGVNVADLRKLIPMLPDVQGTFALDATIFGAVSAPEIDVNARVSGLRYQGVAADTLVIAARYLGERFSGTGQLFMAGAQAAFIEGSIPMSVRLGGPGGPGFNLLEDGPVQAHLTTDSLPVQVLTAVVPQVTGGAGYVSANMTVGGTLGKPIFGGSAVVAGGAFTATPLGVRYQDINGTLTLDGELVRLDQLSIRTGDGTAVLGGTVLFDERNAPLVQLTATLSGFQAVNSHDIATLVTSGQLALSGRLPNPVLTGRVVLDRGTIYIPELRARDPLELADFDIGIGTDSIAPPPIGPAFLAGIRAEGLEVAVGDNVWLQSPDARVQIGGEVIIDRAGNNLVINGELEALRGSYTLRLGPVVREFDIISGRVRFFGTPDLNPELAITAAADIPNARQQLRVLVNITGTLQYPNISLTSEPGPPLPESELISYLIFGRPSTDLSAGAGQLAQSFLVQEALGSLLLPSVEQFARRALPCDYVRLRPRSTSTSLSLSSSLASIESSAVECGVRLVGNLYMTVQFSLPIISGVLTGEAPTSFNDGLLGIIDGIGLTYRPTEQTSASLTIERVRERQWERLLGTQQEGTYQGSLELRRRWEYGRSPSAETKVTPRLPGEVAPAQEK